MTNINFIEHTIVPLGGNLTLHIEFYKNDECHCETELQMYIYKDNTESFVADRTITMCADDSGDFAVVSDLEIDENKTVGDSPELQDYIHSVLHDIWLDYFVKPERVREAAPDLLAALENLVEKNLIIDKGNDHYDEILAAIAKAKGGE